MATLTPYLNFYGKCQEAMNFYKDVLGGELALQLAGESPAKDQMPTDLHDQVLHAHLKSSTIEIMGSDMAPTQPIEGNTVYLTLTCKDEMEARTLFEKFSAGGKVEQALQQAFFGLFGSLEDRFGKHWMFLNPRQFPEDQGGVKG